MILDQNKLNRQTLVVDNWGKHTRCKGTAVLPTGFGKTQTGIVACDRCFTKFGLDIDIIITVPNPEIASNWKNALSGKEYEHKVYVLTKGQVISDGKIRQCKLLIIDECHEFYPDESFNVVNGSYIITEFVLALTATHLDPHNRHKRFLELYPVCDIITDEEAVANGWINKYIEYNIGVDLDTIERNLQITEGDSMRMANRYEYYQYLCERFAHFSSKLGDNFMDLADRIINGYEGPDDKGVYVTYSGFAYATMWAKKMGWHTELNHANETERLIEEAWNPKVVMGYAKNMYNYMRKRKDFIYNSMEKIPVAYELVKKFDTLKFISFSQSTIFADKLAEYINHHSGKDVCTIYHTGLESRPLKDGTGKYITYVSGKKQGQPKMFGAKLLKQFAIDALRSGMVRGISTASALDKGFDVNDLRLAITCSGTSNFNQGKQRKGRSTRVDYMNPDVSSLCVNIYLKGTKDVDWLKARQKKSTHKIHWVDSIDEIDFNPDKTKNNLKLDFSI